MVDLEKQAATSKQATHMNTPSDIDTDSDTDEEDTEFERWQRRELERIKHEEAIRDPNSKANKGKDNDLPPAQVYTLLSHVQGSGCRTQPLSLPALHQLASIIAHAGPERQAQVYAKILPQGRFLSD